MPSPKLSNFLIQRELILEKHAHPKPWLNIFFCRKENKGAVCPKCATLATAAYDSSKVRLKDEPLPGVLPKRRTTQRYRQSILWAAENFTDLKRVRRAYRCSHSFLYRVVYEQLELKCRMNCNYPWPRRIGIDEHGIKRSERFVTMIVDHDNKRLREVVAGKTGGCLEYALSSIPGRENVELVSLDMSDSYKSFVKGFFPNAKMVADKFHVLRLLNGHINRRRKDITGDVRKSPVRKLLLRNRRNVNYFERLALDRWLDLHPDLKEIYLWKENLCSLYRCVGIRWATRKLQKMLDMMAKSLLPEIKTLRKTLLKWRHEILNYFIYGLTNARTEGFNNVAKTVKKRSYGFRNFENYRLRLLSACN
ncbi:MAG: ISL3 family transposase [Bdellovibrionota bacterium]